MCPLFIVRCECGVACVMAFWKSVWILVCVLSFCKSSMTVKKSAKICNVADLILRSTYNRPKNYSLTSLRTDYTSSLVTLSGDRLVTPYSWINVSVMEPERQVAVTLASMLTDLVSAFPENDTASIRYRVVGTVGLITFMIDSVYTNVFVGFSSMGDLDHMDARIRSVYEKNRNRTTFIGSAFNVTKRWRKICNDTLQRDTSDGVNVTFIYHSSTSTFECRVNKSVPVDYPLTMTCVGSGESDHAVIKDVDDGDGQIISWSDPNCNISTANCVLTSYNDWKTVTSVVVANDVVMEDAVTNIMIVPEAAEFFFVDSTVPVGVAVLLVGLVLLVFLYRNLNDDGSHAVPIIRSNVHTSHDLASH